MGKGGEDLPGCVTEEKRGWCDRASVIENDKGGQ
jgi:hypothetical protein